MQHHVKAYLYLGLSHVDTCFRLPIGPPSKTDPILFFSNYNYCVQRKYVHSMLSAQELI